MEEGSRRYPAAQGPCHLSSVLFAIVDGDKAMREALPELDRGIRLRLPCLRWMRERFLAATRRGASRGWSPTSTWLGKAACSCSSALNDAGARPCPSIIISAQTDPATAPAFWPRARWPILTKPINDQVLLRHLNAALGKRAAASSADPGWSPASCPMTEPPHPLDRPSANDRIRLLAAGHRRRAPAAGGRDARAPGARHQLDALLDAVRALDLNPAAIRLFRSADGP